MPATPALTRLLSIFISSSALIKQVNKSIDGTADDEEEGVPTDEAIRAGLELLKVTPWPGRPELSAGITADLTRCPLSRAGALLHAPGVLPLGGDVRVAARLPEDGRREGGGGGAADLQEHGQQDGGEFPAHQVVRFAAAA